MAEVKLLPIFIMIFFLFGCAGVSKYEKETMWLSEPFTIEKGDSLQITFHICDILSITIISQLDGKIKGMMYLNCPKDYVNEFEASK